MVPATMKAWVFYEPENMRLEEVPTPSVADDEVLVRVRACGICGSDVAYYWGFSPLETPTGKGPLILGHEFSGEVVQVGKIPAERGLFSVGDRVTVNPVQYCNACEVCYRGFVNLCENKKVLGVSTHGAFAEYVVSHYTHVYKLPQNVSFQAGAFVEPLANAVYGVKNLQVGLGDTVVVFGPGAIGLSVVSLVKRSGAGKVFLVGTQDFRLQVGREMGADELINIREVSSPYYTSNVVERVAQLTEGRMADRVIVVTGSKEAMQLALEVSGRRSNIVYFGLPGGKDVIEVPALSSIFWDKNIRFSWLAPFTWAEAIQSIARGLIDVERLITHTFPLEELMEGLRIAREKKGNPLKVMIVAE
ncbi:zinc-binding dehydrogenase [Candidatus Caldatribacterium sp.]|uniref:zinc-dependent alcohol dehydrogenase n=1 Tax=Candidatus Caldatribacterium sp. TaxID=2282143 RepID=UPI00299AB6A0|nr:alcohol dehydrogenase catalytic domain-containing protein [Candidatus Caldatribacterium sp.]MDW8081975.1 alcohol dehydrogenase catalytic domain-containing protein [Candidatus Calescibacterium sp.]